LLANHYDTPVALSCNMEAHRGLKVPITESGKALLRPSGKAGKGDAIKTISHCCARDGRSPGLGRPPGFVGLAPGLVAIVEDCRD
jgi:hypothetical protein